MKQKEKLLQEIRKISIENNCGDGESWLHVAGLKALFNYTSAKNLKTIRDHLLWEIENSKKFEDKN
jgi:TnpA family transposase